MPEPTQKVKLGASTMPEIDGFSVLSGMGTAYLRNEAMTWFTGLFSHHNVDYVAKLVDMMFIRSHLAIDYRPSP